MAEMRSGSLFSNGIEETVGEFSPEVRRKMRTLWAPFFTDVVLANMHRYPADCPLFRVGADVIERNQRAVLRELGIG